MPDSNEGAVCGTCGQPPCQCGDARLGAHHTEAWYADHDFTIPAPVVPSDERVEAVDAEDLIAQLHAAVASPTPSQDAEGDGRGRLKREYRILFADAGDSASTALPAQYDDWIDEVESAIRAPYEELVKAARDVAEATSFTEHRWDGGGSMGYECADEKALLALAAALESLGGRS